MRLSPDMFNLARQVRAATDHAANAAGRLAGKELLKFANDESTIAQLKDRIARTVDYLKSIKQSEIEGTETKNISITYPSGQTRLSFLLRRTILPALPRRSPRLGSRPSPSAPICGR